MYRQVSHPLSTLISILWQKQVILQQCNMSNHDAETDPTSIRSHCLISNKFWKSNYLLGVFLSSQINLDFVNNLLALIELVTRSDELECAVLGRTRPRYLVQILTQVLRRQISYYRSRLQTLAIIQYCIDIDLSWLLSRDKLCAWLGWWFMR